jgi:hypothetical protein
MNRWCRSEAYWRFTFGTLVSDVTQERCGNFKNSFYQAQLTTIFFIKTFNLCLNEYNGVEVKS